MNQVSKFLHPLQGQSQESFLSSDSGLSKPFRRQAAHPAPASSEAPWLSSAPHAHRDITMFRCHRRSRTRHKPLSLRGCDNPVSAEIFSIKA